jgi:hypothetical protein
MKLTSEEFNAIFTFYDKVRRNSVQWKSRDPIIRSSDQDGSTQSVGRDQLFSIPEELWTMWFLPEAYSENTNVILVPQPM